MPWFESSKDKQFRELVEGKMQICLKKPNQYQQALMILNSQVTKSNQKAIELIVDHIKQVIKEDDYEPAQKVRAIILLRDLMQTQNKALGKYVVTKILKRLTILAEHRKNEKDENRGANIFKCKKSQEKYGIQFLKILLLCLADWGKNWPRNADGPFQDFHKAYNQLLAEKQVAFPPQQKRVSKSPAPIKMINKQDYVSPPKKAPAVPSDRQIIENPITKPTVRERAPVTGALAEYLTQMTELLNLLSVTLSENPEFGEIWAIIKEFVRQFESVDQKGNLMVAQMIQKGEQNQQIIQVIQENSNFIAQLKKDTTIVDRKNQSYGKYNAKYIKNCKKLVLSLSIFLQKPSSSSNANNNASQNLKPVGQTSINEKVEQIRHLDKPKAEAERNRYGSSYQLRNQLQINLQPIKKQDFNSGTLNKANESEGSSRYNSVAVNQIQKNRNSVSQFNTSKDKQGSNAQQDSQQISKEQVRKKQVQFNQVGQKKQKKQISKITQKNQNQSSFNKFDFDNDVPKTQDNKQNQSFGQFQVSKRIDQEKNQNQNSNSQFFKEIEGRQAVPLPKGTRNRKIQNKPQNNNFFDNSLKSKGQSSEFSGFEKQKNQSKSQQQPKSQSESQEVKQNKQKRQSSSNMQQPKGFDTFKSPNQIARAMEELQKSETKSQKSEVSNPFEKPGFEGENPFKSQFGGEKSIDKSRISDNPFATKYNRSQKNDDENPFETKYQAKSRNANIKQNPFESKINFDPVKDVQEDNKSKSSNPFSSNHDVSNKGQKSSIHSKPPIQKKKTNNVENPFEQKSQQADNPFETVQPNPFANNSMISNPFDKSQKKVPSQSKSLSQRGSFVNVQNAGKVTAKNSSIMQDPFESFKKQNNNVRNSVQNKSKTEGPQKQKQKQKSFQGFDFDDFGNVNNSKSETSSVKQKMKRQSVDKKHNESGFNFSQFGDVRNSKQVSHNMSESNNFFDQPKTKIENKNSQESSFDFFQPKQEIHSKPAQRDNPFETTNKTDNNEKPQTDFFDKSKEEDSKSGNVIKQSKSNDGFNFDDFPNVSKNSNHQKSSNSNNFFEFDQSKGKIVDQNRKQQSKAASSRSSDQWNKFGKVSNQQSDQWNKFNNIAEKQSQQSKSHKDEESRYEPSQNRSQTKRVQVPWFDDKQSQKQVQKLAEISSNRNKVPKVIFENDNQPRFGNQQKSISIQFDEPSPFQKKQIPWQYTQAALPSSTRYNIKPEHILEKKQIVSELDQQHQEKAKRYHQLNQMLTMLKKQYAGNLQKLGQTRSQNKEFTNILKRLKQTNRLKQVQIQELIKKKRKAEELKTKIFQKQRQLYERMKNEKRSKEDVIARSRVGNKWQKFNNNLQKHREILQMEKTYSYFSYYP